MNLFDKITGINSRVIPGRNTTDTFGSASNFFGGTQKSILPQAYTQQAPTQFGMPTQPSIQPPQIQQEDPITAQFRAKGYDDKDIEFLKQAKAKGYTSQQAFGYLDSKKKTQQPVQEASITDKFKMKSSEEFGVMEGIKDIGKFFVNVPADSAQVVGGLYDAVRHPINTLSSMYNVGQGISDKAVFSIANSISSALGGPTAGPTENDKLVSAIGTELVNKYGTAGKFKKAVVENPADTLLTLMGGLGTVSKVAEANNMTNVVNNINKIQQVINPVNILKQESKLITKPIGYIGKEVLPQVLGKTTGTSAETIRTAFSQGGTPEFQSALRGETTPQNILSNVQEGMQAIKNDRAIAYGADYAKLQANKTPLSIDDVAKNFIKSLQDEYKIGVGKKGLDFSQSKITGSTSQSQIENMYKDIVGWKDKTPEGLDVLKQRLQDYYRGTPDSSKGDRLSTIASNAVKQKIVDNVPEYANMTANYEKLTNDIRDITKTLSLGDKTQAQTAITKLSSVLRENFSARQDMVKLIEQYTGKNIQGQIAGASLNPLLAKGLAGVITGGGIVFGQLANPAFWAGLTLASPRLIGEIANTIGVPIEKIKTAINNIKNATTTSNTARSAMEGSTKVKPFTQTPIVAPKVTPKKITPKDPTKTTVNLSQSKGGFIRLPFTSKLNVKPQPKQLFAGENAKAPPKGKTGWFKGADGKMRFEIDDSGASFMNNAVVNKNGKALLGDIFNHKELFEQYPETKSIIVKFNDTYEKGGGSYNSKTNTIEINGLELDARTGEFLGGTKEAKSILLHEIQHAIQEKEGFAKGGNTGNFNLLKTFIDSKNPKESIINLANDIKTLEKRMKAGEKGLESTIQTGKDVLEIAKEFQKKGVDLSMSPEEMYNFLAGEVESRNVQKRMKMTLKERLVNTPESTEDVPRPKQIIRMDSKGPSMSIKGEGVKKEMQTLIDDIKNYKTAEDFYNSYMARDLMDLSNPAKHRFGRLLEDGIDEDTGMYMNAKYTADKYGSRGNNEYKYQKSANVPDVKSENDIVTIYRSTSKKQKEMLPGDFVSFSKEYAEMHNPDGHTLTLKVPAKDVVFQGNDLHEWIYSPEVLRGKKYEGGLAGVYKKYSTKPKSIKGDEALISEARKIGVDLNKYFENVSEKSAIKMADYASDIVGKKMIKGERPMDMSELGMLSNKINKNEAGGNITTVGDIIKDSDLRKLYEKALDTPITILDERVAKKGQLGGYVPMGEGRYGGHIVLFGGNKEISNNLPKSILHESAHAIRDSKGRKLEVDYR